MCVRVCERGREEGRKGGKEREKENIYTRNRNTHKKSQKELLLKTKRI